MPHIWARRNEAGAAEYHKNGQIASTGIDFIHVTMGIETDEVDNTEDSCVDMYIIWNKLAEVATVNIAINDNVYGAFLEINYTYDLHPIDPEVYNGLSVGDFVKVIFKELEKGTCKDPISGKSRTIPEHHSKVLEVIKDPIVVHTEDFLADLRKRT